MKKKILALLLAVVMLVGVMPLYALEHDVDTDGESFVLKAGDATVAKDATTVDVTIDIVENTGVYAMKYYVIYDKELTLVSNDNVTKGTAFADFLVSDVGSKDITPEDMAILDIDWGYMINKDFVYDNDKYYDGFTVDTEDVLVTTVFSECTNWYDNSTDLGTICTFTFQIAPDNTKDEFKVQILPVHGNYIRDDPDHPNADDEGIVEIFDAQGLPGIITITDEGGTGEPTFTEPTIWVSDATINEGAASADFTVNVANNPGLYSIYGFIGYDDDMSFADYGFGDIFAASEFTSKPVTNEKQRDLASTDKNVTKTYSAHGTSAEGKLSTMVYAESADYENNNTNNGVLVTLTLNTATLAAGEYDIVFYYYPASTCNIDFEDVDFELVHGKLTVKGFECAHDYRTEVTLPTCTEEGYTTYICNICGYNYDDDEVEALGHNEVVDAEVPATCTETGLTEGSHCDRCDLVLVPQETVEALGHNEVVDAEVPATCTEAGLTEGSHCDRCDLVIVPQETVEALGHDWELKSIEGECGQPGNVTYECTVCGDTDEKIGDIIEHNLKEEITEPTCTVPGNKHVYCTNCTYVTDEEIPVVPHTEVVDEAVAPTCTATGLTAGSHCDVCGEVLVAQTVVEKVPHTEVADEAVAPTCTATGLTAGSHCDVCGEVLVAQTVVEKVPHTEVADEAVAPTCTATGLTEGSHCDVCGEVIVAQTVVEKVPHTEVADEAVAPTCTATGLTAGSHCDVCGEVIVAQTVVEKLPHSYEDAVTLPTCTEKGFTTYTCSVCGDNYVDNFVDALGHDFVEDVTLDPTCTEKGSKNVTCTRCDYDEDVEIDALGHELVDSDVVDPTCTEKGSKHEACTRCDYEADVEIDALGHVWDDGVVTKEPTVDAEGEKTYTCEVCGETKVEKLEKLPVEENEESKEESKEETKEEPKEEDKSHQTGDNVMMFVFVALIAVVSAAGVMFSKKKLFANK